MAGTQTAEREPKTESLYFRASQDLRESLGAFAEMRGLTVSSAIGRLVELGLEAVQNEDSIKAMEAELADARQELGSARVHLAEARGQAQNLQLVMHSIEGYLRNVRVGQCPNCKQPVMAYDHAVAHRCPHCREALLQPEQPQDTTAVAAGLLGALGGLIIGLAARPDTGSAT